MGTWLPARHDDVWFETPNNVLRMINPERFINAYRSGSRLDLLVCGLHHVLRMINPEQVINAYRSGSRLDLL
eukprot:472437-Pelagomonas_calceolata.AAC.1